FLVHFGWGKHKKLNSLLFPRSGAKPPANESPKSSRPPPTKRAACGCKRPSALNSNQRLVSPAPFVVQANTHDVVGGPECLVSVSRQDRAHAGDAHAGEVGGGGGRGRLLGLAEVDVEIFELGAPAAPKGTLDTCAGGPSGLHIVEVGVGRCRDRAAQCAAVERHPVLDLTVGDASRTIDQDVRAPQETQPGARRAEPLELVVGRHRYRNGADDGVVEGTSERRATCLAGELEIGFEAPTQGAELIVIAGLDTADHAVDFLGRRYRCASQSRYEAEGAGVQGSVVPRITPAVADVGAQYMPVQV